MITCGSCHGQHETVADVRACHEHTGHYADGTTAPAKAAAPKPCPIDVLHELAAKLPDIEHGHYAVQIDGVWKFYQVDRPKQGRWAGYVFVKVQASEELHRLPFGAQIAALGEIAKDPAEALAQYGHQLGRCGVCGRALTDPESIAAGIGPICAGRLAA